MTQRLQRLLDNTRRRARRGAESGAGGFSERLGQRQPGSLGVGCSSSRLLATRSTGRIDSLREGLPVAPGLNVDARTVLAAARSATLAAMRCRCGL